jgi:hypothetical protein
MMQRPVSILQDSMACCCPATVASTVLAWCCSVAATRVITVLHVLHASSGCALKRCTAVYCVLTSLLCAPPVLQIFDSWRASGMVTDEDRELVERTVLDSMANAQVRAVHHC